MYNYVMVLYKRVVIIGYNTLKLVENEEVTSTVCSSNAPVS